MDRCDVAIVGSGPYGLSAAAHLRLLKGLDVRLFGEPMSFWERHMPEGMLLRSPWAGSHIADPENRLTLDAYRALNGNHHLADPLPLKDYLRYAQWFQQQAGLVADRRSVLRVQRAEDGYQLTLADGESVGARRVVVAAGIQPFAHRPKVFSGLPAKLVTHTAEHRELRAFQGREVLVIGGGQSALESAALLCEAGARVEVLVRKPAIHWLGRHQWMQSKGVAWLLYGRGGIGPIGVSLILQHPNLFRHLPRAVQDQWGARAMRPAGASWLKPRVQNVSFHLGTVVKSARMEGGRLRVRAANESERIVDHVVLGTGYRVNIAQYSFLSPEVLRHIDVVNGCPRLDAGFESSVPGLHFLGAPAAWSFGPLMKFVAGTQFASQALRRRMLETRKRHFASQRFHVSPLEPLPLEVKAQKSE
jgi:FAD-dependent urate hydroxylase